MNCRAAKPVRTELTDVRGLPNGGASKREAPPFSRVPDSATIGALSIFFGAEFLTPMVQRLLFDRHVQERLVVSAIGVEYQHVRAVGDEALLAAVELP